MFTYYYTKLLIRKVQRSYGEWNKNNITNAWRHVVGVFGSKKLSHHRVQTAPLYTPTLDFSNGRNRFICIRLYIEASIWDASTHFLHNKTHFVLRNVHKFVAPRKRSWFENDFNLRKFTFCHLKKVENISHFNIQKKSRFVRRY